MAGVNVATVVSQFPKGVEDVRVGGVAPFAFAPSRVCSSSSLSRASFALRGKEFASIFRTDQSAWSRRKSVQGGVLVRASSGERKRPKYIPNKIDDPNYVRIFDTTLRDGEQSPGASLTSKEKLDIARQLAKLGVDIIEAGYPRSSPDDLEAVKMIAKEVGNHVDDDGYVPVICGLSRCNKADIDAAWEGVKHALRPRIHTFIATSEIHMQHKLRKTPEEVIQIASEMVAYARSLGCDDVEFSPEDAGRSDPEFLYRILSEVIKAGATTLNIPDTVGYTLPVEFGGLIAKIKANTPGAENVIISTHCQNDLGLATANTLSGAYNGARQVEVTINGIGERAGNASLEEVVMAIKCRGDQLLGGLHTGIVTKHISVASRMVSDLTGMVVQPHKAIVGANAFAHESGIHQDGMLKFKGTYEIMSPDEIGLVRSDDAGLVLGKLSGRHALKTRLQQLGYELEGKKLDDVFKRFKAVAEKKKTVADEDLEALLSDEVHQPATIWSLLDLQVVCGTMGLSTATVKLVGPDGAQMIGSCIGTGPVDAAYKAVDQIVKEPVTLLEYSMNSVTEGIDAIAHTRVVLRAENSYSVKHPQSGQSVQRSFSGSGAGEDVVVSSVRAYVSALNKILGFQISRPSVTSARSEEPRVAA
ncbi:2-isopropylmalate synthase [Marchantia polymorpha subsp. ruderalis]|uniref:2-isopropylmalate synthase n=2 Tax=Marchantia polymorpha TaxID=3197 RepID=A0A176WL07_MARPO|nr:hypothetical protein AXG93_1200s1730 [Marchantia polymorpha subsp. ruderalis]PTQ49897.1 hypothetical protein MARPO_0002s0332 [Marchantia polymorpha]BBM99982.1 hypothetical protein Mp_1g25400 [Marchantia polymorpha subsp. ruderalis]|eukprot:PTQ49897.1 hypothetical protein MARPO_0002s0332 [Marchantia polymorpha]